MDKEQDLVVEGRGDRGGKPIDCDQRRESQEFTNMEVVHL